MGLSVAFIFLSSDWRFMTKSDSPLYHWSLALCLTYKHQGLFVGFEKYSQRICSFDSVLLI